MCLCSSFETLSVENVKTDISWKKPTYIKIAVGLPLKQRTNVSFNLIFYAFVQLSELKLSLDSGVINTFLVKAAFGYF